MLSALFRSHGWDARQAASANEARAQFKPPPDWITLDLTLPDGNGEELLIEFRRSHSATRIVVVTGTSDPDRIAAVEKLKPDLLLEKPIRFQELLTKMNGVGE